MCGAVALNLRVCLELYSIEVGEEVIGNRLGPRAINSICSIADRFCLLYST
jgi:hypothetical protein